MTNHPFNSPATRKNPGNGRKRMALWALRVFAYALAFLSLPALVGLVGINNVVKQVHSQPEAYEVDLAPPLHDPSKPTVAVLLSNVWTEITDFLGPYQVLSASEAFNVYAVAPERKLTTLNGVLDVLPHYSIAEFEAQGIAPDVIVVPYIADIHGEANRPLLTWIKAQADQGVTVLSICMGAEVVAASGALEGRQATTIWRGLDQLEKAYPATRWIRGVRYVDDGNIISSAGVTSGIDATLYLLKRLKGEALATEVAEKLNYPHVQFMSDPMQPVSYRSWDLAPMALHAAYQWDRSVLGVMLHHGVTELELASVVEMYSAAVASAVTIAQTRQPIETAHGLHVVPRRTLSSAPRLDRLLIPGVPEQGPMTTWASQKQLPVATPHADLMATGAHYSFDAIILDLAARENQAIAQATAASLEYPIEHLQLPGTSRPLSLMLRPLLLGLLGVGLLFAVEKAVKARRERQALKEPHASLKRSPVG
jgi:transcriptional regulator GlxA family with amidase domain